MKTYRLKPLSTLLRSAALLASASLAGQALAGQLTPAAEAKAQAGGVDKVDVIVVYDRQPDAAEDARLSSLGAGNVRRFDAMAMTALSVPPHVIANVADAKGVRFVATDDAVGSQLVASPDGGGATTDTTAAKTTGGSSYNNGNSGLETANAPFVSGMSVLSSSGIGIAVLDSGVAAHGDLNVAARYDCRLSTFTGKYAGTSNCLSTTTLKTLSANFDKFGHGTHVAGVASGDGAAYVGKYRGMNTKPPIHSFQVLGNDGSGNVSDVIAALNWIFTNGKTAKIRVVNLSLGKGISESAALDPLVIATERVWDAGFVVVASAGNYGLWGNFTITSPGNSRKIITVGSLTDSRTGFDYSDDYVSTYSSRGPTLVDHYLKPDLIAPGNRYVATKAPNSVLETIVGLFSDYLCGQTCTTSYLELSGTSMAAGMVSGTAAMMLAQNSNLSPSTVKARLMRSARKIDGDPTATGAGVLDATAALLDTGVVSGQALSPKLLRVDNQTIIAVEDTAKLWGGQQWGAGYLWADGYMWSNAYTWADGYLWADGYTWADGYLWADGYMWADGYLWADHVGLNDSAAYGNLVVEGD